ncbi:MAG: hypothetical protein J6B06_01640 [Lachnospiraceae bacterium]|nr:hypothetical protein [Lachnospiraceae bacterium]
MKRKLQLRDIERLHSDMDYTQLYDYLLSEIEKGTLVPVKASGLNGRKPALYNAYWLIEEDKNYEDLFEEMRYKISPQLKLSYYEKNPEKYIRDREQILALSEYLLQSRVCLKISETVNERSFEIWKREKFLDREGGKELLSRLGISMKEINCYQTSEPMSYYSHIKQSPQNFLIIENKDTFYSMRKHLISGNDRVMGLKTGTLIYGGGKGIYRSFEDYVMAVEPYFAEEGNRVYYFGDLDYEGILIYETLVEKYKKDVRIELFTAAYERMLNRAEEFGMERLPETKEGQNNCEGNLFFSFFSNITQRKMKQILQSRRYIPQEILNANDY